MPRKLTPSAALATKLKSEIENRETQHRKEMEGPLHPSVGLLCKLGSIIVHAEEAASPDGHPFDNIALRSLTTDPEVLQWLAVMRKAAFLPVKRGNPDAA